ncbi:hypothetical protein [Streptomyces katsurahamanus]|uniref:Uncharacterized protein n=1 Tax=Streptomyces katsurahamanus TaxID=2577098 RepID=A0ABW9NU60_9ACTN|nr:hypothetical protein [Streptomyces katsurahamanus]MQS36414.1 hypothetical protein [Streptomyces katsurahamanus]
MVLLGQQHLAAHRGPSRRSRALVLAAGLAVLFSGGWLLADRYGDRPPWAEDVAYEAGFLHGNRVRQYDPTGEEAAALLAGGCERLAASGDAGVKAAYDPGRWATGCRDGAAGKQPAEQGLLG